ncbi:S-adenosyl-L-methionine-dependent methyltransferase [Chytriomyces sp. MP71]|nr:S-adenosyl-L-methionine-dependent methyltransferase [Chytriomyces sp. MP71]
MARDPWGTHAEKYDAVFGPVLALYSSDALVLASEALAACGTVLDVGCGTGASTLHLIGRGFSVTATDLSQGMLHVLARKLGPEPRASLVPADGQTLEPFADASFDAAISAFGIVLFPDRVAGWNAARRILKDKGVIVALCWSERYDGLRLVDSLKVTFGEPEPIKNPCTTAQGFTEEVEGCGFEVCRIVPVRHDFVFPCGRLFVEGMWDNPFFARMDTYGRDAVNGAIASYFGKTPEAFMDEPLVVLGEAYVLVGRKFF